MGSSKDKEYGTSSFFLNFVSQIWINYYKTIHMKAINILFFSFFLGLSAVAQQAQTPEQTALALTQSQTTMLKLTAAQQEEVYAVHFGIAQKNQGILLSNYPEDQKKAIIKSNEQARMAMLKNILTAEQFAKLEKAATEQRND